jgi:hypothetical protein
LYCSIPPIGNSGGEGFGDGVEVSDGKTEVFVTEAVFMSVSIAVCVCEEVGIPVGPDMLFWQAVKLVNRIRDNFNKIDGLDLEFIVTISWIGSIVSCRDLYFTGISSVFFLG